MRGSPPPSWRMSSVVVVSGMVSIMTAGLAFAGSGALLRRPSRSRAPPWGSGRRVPGHQLGVVGGVEVQELLAGAGVDGGRVAEIVRQGQGGVRPVHGVQEGDAAGLVLQPAGGVAGGVRGAL